jgi:hypothetical protein
MNGEQNSHGHCRPRTSYLPAISLQLRESSKIDILRPASESVETYLLTSIRILRSSVVLRPEKIEIDGSGRRLARWLGVAHRVGSNLCYWLLLESGKVIAHTTVQHVV